jgi:4-amino-4-deoxy-L-arabinose transferase-like glycosyltransferase
MDLRSEIPSRPVALQNRLRTNIYDVGAAVFLFAVIGALYIALPKHGDIWWSDASRHALNGAFVLDFMRAMPFRHPVAFAYDYYRQWPALTILFYPPLFYVPLAAVYAVAGVSEASALATELAFLLALAWGAYRLSRQWLEPVSAVAVALLLIGAPELLFWGRQIMLDVPSYAFLIWAADAHLRYLKTGSHRALFVAVICAVLAIYTKYNAAFFVGVMAISLVSTRGVRSLFDRTVLWAMALGIILLVPLVAVFFAFSAFNLAQAATASAGEAGRWSVAGLTYYASIMRSVVSWPTLALAGIYVLALPFAPRLRLPRTDALFLLVWVIGGYAFYAMIEVKEPRHILFITYPIALAAILLLDRTLARFSWRSAVPFALACGVFAVTVATRPAPYITGMREAAEDVARLAPPESDVAFWGRADGAFIFALRAYTDRRDLDVVRLDKILFRGLAVSFARGFTETDLTPEQLTATLQKLHAQYVVVQSRYRDDLAPVKTLEAALHSNKFTEVTRIPMSANYPFADLTEMVIYRLVADVPKGRVAPPMEIKLIDRSIPAAAE